MSRIVVRRHGWWKGLLYESKIEPWREKEKEGKRIPSRD